MPETMTRLADGFWRITGEVRVGGLLDIGTQCSLVRRDDGRFVFLDSYTLPAPVRQQVDALTDEGRKLDAIINLHPFHTLHCEWMHRTYPDATLYGTTRHHEKLPGLPWHATRCEEPALAEKFGDTFAFSQPKGMPLVCEDESVHFSSILALHRASGTIHVDDTLVYLDKGFPLSALPMTGRLSFHPTLDKALTPEAGAADEFRAWAMELGIDWADARRVAAAHNAVRELGEEEFPTLIGEALGRVKPVLDRHRAEYD